MEDNKWSNIEDLSKELIDTPLSDLEGNQRIIQLFNISQARKDVLRMVTKNEVVDGALNQLNKRVKERPDEFSTKDLLDTINAMQQSLDKTSQNSSRIEEMPLIQIKTDNIINVGNNTYTKEESKNIQEAVRRLLAKAKEENEDVIDIEVEEAESDDIRTTDGDDRELQ